jgi:hypothetical protein
MFDKLDDWLCEGWRSAWRWWSVQMHMAASMVLMALQMAPVMPAEVQKLIPQPWGAIATAVWTLLGIYARVAKQKKLDNGK